VARSAEWITTSYNNMNSPSTFYTVASEDVDTTPPTITVNHPKADVAYTAQVKIDITATDSESGVSSVTYNLWRSGGWYWAENQTYTTPTTVTLPHSDYRFYAWATDMVGNTAEDNSVCFTVEGPQVQPYRASANLVWAALIVAAGAFSVFILFEAERRGYVKSTQTLYTNLLRKLHRK